jgi:hypothetical protein
VILKDGWPGFTIHAQGVRMSSTTFRRSAEGFFISSAVFGVLLAALLAQTHVLAFGSFAMMAIVFLVADLIGYIMMKLGLMRSPKDWGKAND